MYVSTPPILFYSSLLNFSCDCESFTNSHKHFETYNCNRFHLPDYISPYNGSFCRCGAFLIRKITITICYIAIENLEA